MTNTSRTGDMLLMIAFSLMVLAGPVILAPFGAGYPDLLQRFAIFGIFAVGYNILFGLTGYLSFGHAAFLGVGSYMAVWSFKLLSLDVIPAILLGVLLSGLFALVIGFVSLRRSGIYFSILTLAFAQMCYNMAYSVLTPVTNGETGLKVLLSDQRLLEDPLPEGVLPLPSILGVPMNETWKTMVMGYELQFNVGFYVCAVMLILAFWVALRITRSPFGLMLRAIKTNQNRLSFCGISTKPYALSAFVISGMYAGLAGSLMACTDPLAGAERMQWTASGEVVLMTILGGVGTLIGPVLGAGFIKYFENIFSRINHETLEATFAFLPDGLRDTVVWAVAPFTGEGWALTLGVLFMVIVIFLPGGLVEGFNRLIRLVRPRRDDGSAMRPVARPAE